MRTVSTLLLTIAMALPSFAQITVATRELRVIEAPIGSVIIGKLDSPQFLVLPDGTDGKSKFAVQLTYSGVQASDPKIEAFDISSGDEVVVTKIDSADYLVFGSGKTKVLLIDWDARTNHRIVIDVSKPDDSEDEGSDDQDDDTDDDGNDPPPDVIVPNAYGVGEVSYKWAVKDDPATAEKYLSIYRQASEFLFGKPSPKAIISSGEPDADNPQRSVVAWMRQESNKIVCRDEQTCKKWATWQENVNEAINAAQDRRQYTKADWYQTFQEVADALELAQR